MAIKKIIVLLGKSLSGKTTVCNELKEKYDINKVVSFTTRPIRDGEQNGLDYNFVNNDFVFFNLVMRNLVALRVYTPAYGIGNVFKWYYGFCMDDIEKYEYPFLITDVEGLEDIKYRYGKQNVVSIYLNIDRKEQEKRMLKRKDNNKEEVLRRLNADELDFAFIEKNVDHVIDSKSKTIAKQINKIIEQVKA